MYRDSVDNAVTYTPDDLVLFRESPFALWMERLTLENPDHGIPPDINIATPQHIDEQQGDIVATLRAEGRNVVLVDGGMDDADRRTDTHAAMHSGADFIVNGQLAAGALSGSVNMLMRTSGYSELGDFLYIPCETQAENSLHSAFRLSFTADLLDSLQGQLPPQMLIIRDGADVVPLQTEDHIYYYRAVLKRFMHAMNTFRKHRMPDPAESAHFGRWSECASEVLKQRALGEQHRAVEPDVDELQEEAHEEAHEEVVEMPQLRVASGSATTQGHYDREAHIQPGFTSRAADKSAVQPSAAPSSATGQTLAEQALKLAPGSFRGGVAPGHTPNLARFGRLRSAQAENGRGEIAHSRRSTDRALKDLEFIGSRVRESLTDSDSPPQLDERRSQAPAPTLRESPQRERPISDEAITSGPAGLVEIEPRAPVFLPPDPVLHVEPPSPRLESPPPESEEPRFVPVERSGHSTVIDSDSPPDPSLPRDNPEEDKPGLRPFNDRLITSDECDDS